MDDGLSSLILISIECACARSLDYSGVISEVQVPGSQPLCHSAHTPQKYEFWLFYSVSEKFQKRIVILLQVQEVSEANSSREKLIRLIIRD